MKIGFFVGLFAAAAVVVGLIAAPLGASGQEPDDTPVPPGPRAPLTPEEREARHEAMREAFADELGVSVDRLDSAYRTVLEAQIDQALADGRIDEAQAERLRERLAEAEFRLHAPYAGHRGHGPGIGPRGLIERFRSLEPLSGEERTQAEAAATAAVPDGEIVFAHRGAGETAYVVALRTDDGVTVVRLDAEFDVLDTHEMGTLGGFGRFRGEAAPSFFRSGQGGFQGA